MKILESSIFKDVFQIIPNIYSDSRGFFYESYNQKNFYKLRSLKKIIFVQDNLSKSKKGVLRGLHYQLKPYEQAKLITVLRGKIFDVVVDIRKNSKTFGKWESFLLSSEDRNQLFIPEGFAHGFLSMEDDTEVFYKANKFYSPEHERHIIFSDPDLNIFWPNDKKIICSKKDRKFNFFKDMEFI